MTYRVVFSPEAQEQLAELFQYVAEAASPDVALRPVADRQFDQMPPSVKAMRVAIAAIH